MKSCITGKRGYPTLELAEEALIGAWIAFEYGKGSGPINVYQCDECGDFHLTSKGEMNTRLKSLIDSGEIAKQKLARSWEQRFKGR